MLLCFYVIVFWLVMCILGGKLVIGVFFVNVFVDVIFGD